MRLCLMCFDLYLGWLVFIIVLLIWVVLVGLDVVMVFFGEFKDIGKNGYILGYVVVWVLYMVLCCVYIMFLMVVVIGVLMGLG